MSRPPAITLLLLTLLAGCESESKIVQYDPFLGRLPGAESGLRPVFRERTGPRGSPGNVDLSKVAIEELRTINSDGSLTLKCPAIRHCMLNLALCLQEGRDDLLYEQLISNQTKSYLRDKGEDPRSATLAFLKDNYDDLMLVFQRIPAGERSPGVMMEQISGGQFRLVINEATAKDLRFSQLWFAMERGQWRFWWAT